MNRHIQIVDQHVAKYLGTAQTFARNTNSHNHYALLVYGDMVLASGYNTFPNTTLRNVRIKSKYGRTKYSVHAERNVLESYLSSIKAKQRRSKTKNCYMIIFSITRGGKLRESKPCASCIELLREFKIREVYYSTRSGKWDFSKVDDMEGYPSSGIRCMWDSD